MRACECCAYARESPGYAYYCPACLWCGSRLIWAIGNRPGLPVSVVQARRRQVLADWLARGHSEPQIRELAKGPPCFQPPNLITAPTGPDDPTASARPPAKKRR